MVLEQLTLFPEAFLANPSATQVREKGRRMTVISGQRCEESSMNADRLGLLLKMLEDSSVWRSQIGSLYWKAKDLPKKKRRRCSKASGKILKTWGIGRSQSLFQLARSERRTKDFASSSQGLWATPNAADAVDTTGGGQSRSLRDDVRMWPTPRANDAEKRGNIADDPRNGLPSAVLWPTPQARDYRCGDDPEGPRATRKREQGWTPGLNDAVKLWPTPKGSIRGDCPSERERRTPDLQAAVKMWPTPAAQDAKNASLPPSQAERDTIPGAIMREGQTGQLNPDWVEALMCVPEGWTDVQRTVELPSTLDDPGEYVDYIRSYLQPALMGQPQHDWEPPRVASGVKGRVPRLKMLGNGVVPLQILPIVAIIAMIESETVNA